MLYLYADDAKLFSFIKTLEDSASLQKDLDSLTGDPVVCGWKLGYLN